MAGKLSSSIKLNNIVDDQALEMCFSCTIDFAVALNKTLNAGMSYSSKQLYRDMVAKATDGNNKINQNGNIKVQHYLKVGTYLYSGVNIFVQDYVQVDGVISSGGTLKGHEKIQVGVEMKFMKVITAKHDLIVGGQSHGLWCGNTKAADSQGGSSGAQAGGQGEDNEEDGEDIDEGVLEDLNVGTEDMHGIGDPLMNSQDLRGVAPILFFPSFLYGCIQLVIGKKKNITNMNKTIPKHIMEETFMEYRRRFSNEVTYMENRQTQVTYSNALTSLLAVSLKNIVVETFELRCIKYLEHRLHQQRIDEKATKKFQLNLYDPIVGAGGCETILADVCTNNLEQLSNIQYYLSLLYPNKLLFWLCLDLIYKYSTSAIHAS
ncbi:hypothetical protein BC941DRAFT_473915 [Chlamydoabsidia padenii]|nr:hypothetical protein BC941DRAFT_473915 [Chlamydoabsidia padenii]